MKIQISDLHFTYPTGVDALHADLGPRWRGGTNRWFDPYGEHPQLPHDADGHGTAVMGVLVGDLVLADSWAVRRRQPGARGP